MTKTVRNVLLIATAGALIGVLSYFGVPGFNLEEAVETAPVVETVPEALDPTLTPLIPDPNFVPEPVTETVDS